MPHSHLHVAPWEHGIFVCWLCSSRPGVLSSLGHGLNAPSRRLWGLVNVIRKQAYPASKVLLRCKRDAPFIDAAVQPPVVCYLELPLAAGNMILGASWPGAWAAGSLPVPPRAEPRCQVQVLGGSACPAKLHQEAAPPSRTHPTCPDSSPPAPQTLPRIRGLAAPAAPARPPCTPPLRASKTSLASSPPSPACSAPSSPPRTSSSPAAPAASSGRPTSRCACGPSLRELRALLLTRRQRQGPAALLLVQEGGVRHHQVLARRGPLVPLYVEHEAALCLRDG